MEYNESLQHARKLVGTAMSDVQDASNLIHNFDKSNPLNILYKELRASYMLLSIYTGDIKELPKDGYEIITPQSIQAYHNLNSEEET
uniref:Uncharacterized protein n=1 Tax=viral metagenome TaxID=1070528 RepID=A0A6M3JFG3_9ZZZZ